MKHQDVIPPDQHSQEPTLNSENADGASADTSNAPLSVPARFAAQWRSSWLATIWQKATQSSHSRRMLAASTVIVGVVIIIFLGRLLFTSTPQHIAPDTRRFFVASQPTLVFDHFIGNVRLMSGPDKQVSIKEKKNGETDAVQIRYAQRGDTIVVTVDVPGGLLVDTWVDFDVNVPRGAGLRTAAATGTLEATGLSGEIALSDTNGSVWATNLTGSISLKTQSGSINLKEVTGQVTAVTQNGTITTTATHLSGHSLMQAANGTINFHGTLSHTGRYLFLNSNGTVGLALPSDSAFALRAYTITGSINTDFPGVTISQKGSWSEAHGTVGAAPQAQLTIETTGGTIGLYQGG